MKMDWIPNRSDEILSNVMDDGTVIVTPSDGSLNVVNEAGSYVWELVDGQNSIEVIAQQVVARFEVTPDVARSDVLTFMQALDERGLLSWSHVS